MLHSTVTSKGQITIPRELRSAFHIKQGDRLEFVIENDHATMRVQPALRTLKGALASRKGRGMSFAEIREAATRRFKREGLRR